MTMSTATGEVFANAITVGQIFTHSFTTTIPDNWNPDNMEVIAFVSEIDGNRFPVLQAASAHVIE